LTYVTPVAQAFGLLLDFEDTSVNRQCVTFFLDYLQHALSQLNLGAKDVRPAMPEAAWYVEAFLLLNKYMSHTPSSSLDSAVEHLREKGLFRGFPQDPKSSLKFETFFVFCIIGISTCLYYPDGSGVVQRGFSIEETHKDSSYTYAWILSTSIPFSHSTIPITDLLYDFGHLLPFMDINLKADVNYSFPLDSTHFNTHVMCSILDMKIEWTDVLGAHLDYDKQHNTVYIFKYPSICYLNSRKTGTNAGNGLFQSCIAAQDLSDSEDIMNDILLSIYLIFGQTKKAQNHHLHKSHHHHSSLPVDPLLQLLSSGTWPFPHFKHQPKSIYNLSTDFPLLQAKMDILQDHIRKQEPKTLGQIWGDKRTMSHWYTFWAVVIMRVWDYSMGLVRFVLRQFKYTTRKKGSS
jgi:hypothetical protein